ncbi:MAG: bifunctional 4-hydroxy-2-oxoglutarate aldolase/2-dehydro-3-deoxy-phosphogluconate aldolase, partial [Clostridia bacterium]|nr:bifunctional 4-hydroxy-2-oxoglutarate aldolase/2-dehydro-3-deoxy-phosphogluconate aldolase [Clostridia bacterium]
MDQIFEEIRLNGLVPVLKFQKASDAAPTCEALRRGGLNVAEITFRTDAAEASIQAVCRAMPDMLVGAGTVTRIEQAERAVAAGARFIVAPGFNPRIVSWCVEHGVAVLPGVSSPSEIEAAMEFGLQYLKFFPAEALGGVRFIKALRGPYSGVSFVPTGGVSEENLLEYLSTPGVAACGGSWMVPAAAIENGEYDAVAALVRRAVLKMLDFRFAHVGVNTEEEGKALAAADRYARLFGFAVKAGGSSVMAGGALEFTKTHFPGEHGHIGIQTADIGRAKHFLGRAGVEFDEASAKTDAKGK